MRRVVPHLRGERGQAELEIYNHINDMNNINNYNDNNRGLEECHLQEVILRIFLIF